MAVMFILAVGMLARAAVGRVERLLNIAGRAQAMRVHHLCRSGPVLAVLGLIPRIGIEGAGIATSSALVVESIML